MASSFQWSWGTAETAHPSESNNKGTTTAIIGYTTLTVFRHTPKFVKTAIFELISATELQCPITGLQDNYHRIT